MQNCFFAASEPTRKSLMPQLGGSITSVPPLPGAARGLDPNIAYTVSLFGIDAAAFAHYIILVCRQISERLDQAAWPADRNRVGLASGAQAKVQPQIALR